MSRWIIAAQALFIAVLAGIAIAAAQGAFSSVEVRVWQDTRDDRNLYLSARYEGGSWRTLGTVPVDVSRISASGRWRYGDIVLTVPVPDSPLPPGEADAARRRCENAALAALQASDAAYEQAIAAWAARVGELDRAANAAQAVMQAAQAEAERARDAAGEDGDAIDAADAAYQRALSEAQRVFEEGQEKRVSERAELDRTWEAAGTAREQAATDYATAVARCDGADQ